MRVSKDNLAFITGRPAAVFSDLFVDALGGVMHRYEINTPLRAAHFLAQLCHESGGFRYPEEIWGPTPHQERYEGRTDLGNVLPGDGYRFRGRGYIQLTGRDNYKEYAADVGTDLVSDPDLVTELPWSLDVAGWFWQKRSINVLADKDDFLAVTKRINGGTNGLDDRKRYLRFCKAVFFPRRVSPKPAEKMPEAKPEMVVRKSALPEVALADEKPWWASKRIMGWAVTVVGAFGANTEILSALVGSYDDIIIVAGLLLNLYGSLVAKKRIRLWKKKG